MKLRITLEGVNYEVDVEVMPEHALPAESEPEILPKLKFPPPRPDIRPQDRVCRSPISGLVISVPAEVGSRLHKDDTIAVIEAMKMLISIPAPLDGVVEEVQVRSGDSVSPGQVLCVLTQ